jgi:hypothetical protein
VSASDPRFPPGTDFAVFDRATQRCKRTMPIERPSDLRRLVEGRDDEVYVVGMPAPGNKRRLAVIDTSEGDIETVIDGIVAELDASQ